MIYTISDTKELELIENMRIGFDGRLEKRQGTKNICTLSGKLRGALSVSVGDEDFIYLVVANRLFKLKVEEDLSYTSTVIGSLSGASFANADEKAELFMFGGKVCILAGGEYYVSDGATVSKVSGYIPLIRKMTDRLGAGEDFERINLLTDKVRVRFIADGSTRDFRLNYKVKSVDAVYVAGTLLETSEYSITSGSYYTIVSTTSVYTSMSDEETDIVEIHFTLDKISERSRVTSCRHAAVYGGDTDSRVFLYGGNEQAAIFPSEPSGADSDAGQTISYDYFPVGGQMVVGDGNLPVCGACRQFDRLAIFTSESAYYTYPHDDGEVNTLKRYSFPILPLNSDVGATELGGAILVENEPYSIAADSLYRFKSTSVRDERLAIRVEPPQCFSFSGLTEGLRLYANKLRGELWCYNNEQIIIYNARSDCWYRFTGVNADLIFNFRGEAAFISNRSVKLFCDSAYTDSGTKYLALCETGWFSVDKALGRRMKGIRFGAVIGSSDSPRTLTLKLYVEQGHHETGSISSEKRPLGLLTSVHHVQPSDSPIVLSCRALLRRTSYAKLRISSSEPGTIESEGESVETELPVESPLTLESVFLDVKE